MDLVTYLAFDGDCEAAFKHYAKVLRGEILMMMRGADMPPEVAISPEAAKRIMHARLKVGDRLLMGGDAHVGSAAKPQGFCAHIMIEDPIEAERIYRELGEGGTSTMPLHETFWARRFGMLTDRFGVPWMVNCEKPMGATEGQPKSFAITRTFAAPRATIWQAFTDPDLMKRWWGPKGAEVGHSKMDLRPGGTYHYSMRTADGKDIWGRQVYREIEPPERLVFINSFSDAEGGLSRHPFAPTWPLELLSTFELREADGRTAFTVTWTPHYATPEERAAFDAGHDSMRQGWTGTLDQLEAFLAKA